MAARLRCPALGSGSVLVAHRKRNRLVNRSGIMQIARCTGGHIGGEEGGEKAWLGISRRRRLRWSGPGDLQSTGDRKSPGQGRH